MSVVVEWQRGEREGYDGETGEGGCSGFTGSSLCYTFVFVFLHQKEREGIDRKVLTSCWVRIVIFQP